MPGLGNQLAQTAHYLVALVVGDIRIIELFQTVVDFTHFVDQRTTRNFGRVRGQHQLQRQGFNGLFNRRFVEIGLVFEFTQSTGNHFRVARRFAFWRNAVVLLGGVGQIQELAKRTGDRQQLIVGQVLQRGKQLLAIGFVARTRRFGQLTDRFYTVKNVLTKRILDGIA